MAFGKNLIALRRGRGLSQEELGEAVGVSRQTVSKWETGQTTPELDKLMTLADLFGLALDELVGRVGKAEEDTPLVEEEQPAMCSRRGRPWVYEYVSRHQFSWGAAGAYSPWIRGDLSCERDCGCRQSCCRCSGNRRVVGRSDLLWRIIGWLGGVGRIHHRRDCLRRRCRGLVGIRRCCGGHPGAGGAGCGTLCNRGNGGWCEAGRWRLYCVDRINREVVQKIFPYFYHYYCVAEKKSVYL